MIYLAHTASDRCPAASNTATSVCSPALPVCQHPSIRYPLPQPNNASRCYYRSELRTAAVRTIITIVTYSTNEIIETITNAELSLQQPQTNAEYQSIPYNSYRFPIPKISSPLVMFALFFLSPSCARSRDSGPGSHGRLSLLPPSLYYGSCLHFFSRERLWLQPLLASPTRVGHALHAVQLLSGDG